MELELQKEMTDKAEVKDPAKALAELAPVFEAYNELTERMSRAHEQLQSEVVRLREELREKNELLERKSRLAALGEMSAGVAHEIRNPLGGVLLYASLLAKDLQDRPDSLKWVSKISSAVRGLNQIVTDMLAFTNNNICEKTELNLAGLMAEVADLACAHARQKKVSIVTDCDSDLAVKADLNMMQRVLLNLVLNAVDAVGDNGVVTIRGRMSRAAQYAVKIEVADNGCGIPQEVLPKIFNPFFTTKDVGTGLGLAIVHRLVECHEGIITACNNKNGKGAKFTVLLP